MRAPHNPPINWLDVYLTALTAWGVVTCLDPETSRFGLAWGGSTVGFYIAYAAMRLLLPRSPVSPATKEGGS